MSIDLTQCRQSLFCENVTSSSSIMPGINEDHWKIGHFVAALQGIREALDSVPRGLFH